MAIYYGYNTPFLGGPSVVMSRQEDERLIKNDLLQLIMTVPGERVHRPTFGTLVRSSLFEPLTDQLLDDLRSSILEAIIQHEPRLIGTDVVVEGFGDERKIHITVTGRLTAQPNRILELETNVDLLRELG